MSGSRFDALNDANAINFFAPRRSSLVLDAHQPHTWASELARLFVDTQVPGATLQDRSSLSAQLSEAARPEPLARGVPPRRAAFLVGSAKPKGTSASELLARALMQRLSASGVSCELHFATEFVHEREATWQAARSIASSDLFVLASPLYIDAFPALATHALELVQQVRATERDPASFVPIVNCGFPEPEHTRTALQIARHFANAAGYIYSGALPLGAGGVVTSDHPLSIERPPVGHIVRALALAASALAQGDAIPAAALTAITEPWLPEVAYRIMGDLGFRWQAHLRGTAQAELRATPFETDA